MAGTTIEQRIEIVESLAKGEPVWRIARRMRVRPRTIRKWRQRLANEGRAGLQSQMGRPATGALGSFDTEISTSIRRWCLANPGWGPTTLLAELKYNNAFRGRKLPSRSAIARFLSDEGLSETRPPAVPLPKSKTVNAVCAHQIWEMDARGYEKMPDVGFVTLIHLNDCFSHVRLLSYPCDLGQRRVERHAQTEDYQAALRTAFMTWGLPDTLQVDHESVFYDNRSKSPFPTRFHLWLVALGISLTFIRHNRPTEQGMTERSHQLWYRQVIQGHTFPDWNTLYNARQTRRTFLNHHLPCRATADQPPLAAHPDARHSGKLYQMAFEEDIRNLPRIYDYLAQGRWFRIVSQSGTLSLGGSVYYIGAKWHKQQTEISFQPDDQKLLFHDEAGHLIAAQPIKAITKDTLSGNLADLSRLPSFQLALPFSWAQIQMARLLETIA